MAFWEGVALYHVANPPDLDRRAGRRTGLVAEGFWQVFVVAEEPDQNGNHGCTVFRYWENVRPFGSGGGDALLAHRSSRALYGGETAAPVGAPSDARIVRTLVSGGLWDLEAGTELKAVGRGEDLGWRAIELPTEQTGDAQYGAIEVTWPTGAESRNYGYAVRWPSSLLGRRTMEQHWECVSGASTIPVAHATVVAVVPLAVRVYRDATPHVRGRHEHPDAIGFHAEDNPVKTVAAYMDPNHDNRRLRHLFTEAVRAVPLFRDGGVGLPRRVAEALIELGEGRGTASSPFSSRLSDSTFVSRVVFPEPLLHYGLVWELPERGGKIG